jgi:arylformamidase
VTAWIDITRTLDRQMIGWPGDPPYQHWFASEISGVGTANVSAISTSVHIGTHIDAPLHFVAGGLDAAGLPLEKLCGPARVVHVTEQRDVQPEDLKRGGVAHGERVLLRTTNELLWSTGKFEPGFSALSASAAQWLVDHEVPLVGIDYLSVDPYRDEHKSAHQILLSAGVIAVEGIDLSGVDPGRYELIALPMKIAGSDGAPARVIIRPA